MKRAIFSVCFLSIIGFAAYGDDIAQSHVIENVKYYPMLDGYCAMTALRMNLGYYGIETEQSLLLNLGWNYGFFYMSSPFYTVAYPDTDPVEAIVFAAECLGLRAEVVTHESLDEAKQTLVKYISQEKPVLVQWIAHTVIAYGYRDSGARIIYNDPAKPGKQKRRSAGKDFPVGLGQEVEKEIDEWLGWPEMWEMRQFQVVVVEPDGSRPAIDWKKIWKRSAEKTLGRIQNNYPGHYGISGLRELAKSINTASALNKGQDLRMLENLEMTFELGVGFRRNAATFLAGQASISRDKNLSAASRSFLESAHLFGEGLNLLRWLKDNPEKRSEVAREIVQILQHLIDSEKSAAEFLLAASE